jgi:hypothetical protein
MCVRNGDASIDSLEKGPNQYQSIPINQPMPMPPNQYQRKLRMFSGVILRVIGAGGGEWCSHCGLKSSVGGEIWSKINILNKKVVFYMVICKVLKC